MITMTIIMMTSTIIIVLLTGFRILKIKMIY